MRYRSILLSVFGVAACGPNNAWPSIDPPQALGNSLALLDRGTGSLVIVSPDGEAGPERGRRVHRMRVGSSPLWARSIPTPGDPAHRRLLVLDPREQTLHVVHDASGASSVVELGVSLSEVAVSDDGRWGVAFQPEDAPLPDGMFVFPNTIAVLDLNGESPQARSMPLGEGGLRPRKVAFSAPLTITRNVGGATEPREVQVALVFTRGGVIPVDLERAAVGPFVPLAPADEEREVVPTEVLFTNNRGDAIRGEPDGVERAFVRTSQGELFVLALQVGSGTNPPVLVSLENVITPSAGVHDIELFFAADGASILLAAADQSLLLVNGYSGVSQSFDAPTPVDRLVAFDAADGSRSLALAYSADDPAARLLRIDPRLLAERRSNGLVTVRLGSEVTQIELAGGQAMLRYTNDTDIGLLPLQSDGEVLDIRLAATPVAETLSDDGSRLLLVTFDTSSHEQLVEVRLDGTFSSRQVAIEDGAYQVGTLAEWVWVYSINGSPRLTFFPEDRLESDAGITFGDLQTARIFDEPVPAEDAP